MKQSIIVIIVGGIIMIIGALVAGYNSSWWVAVGIIVSVFGNDLMRSQRTIILFGLLVNRLKEAAFK